MEKLSSNVENELEQQREELRKQREELEERYAEMQRQQDERQEVPRLPSAKSKDGRKAVKQSRQAVSEIDERLLSMRDEYRETEKKLEQQLLESENERKNFKNILDTRMVELEKQTATINKFKETIEEQNKVINTVNDEFKRLKEMDLDAFISQEKQVLQKLSDEINSIKGSLKDAQDEGELSPDDAKLLRSGNYLKKQVEEIQSAFSELDERLARVRNELVRVSTIEYKFKGVEDRLTAMQRNLENIIEVQLMAKSKEAVEFMESGKESIIKDIQAVFSEQKSYIDDYENRLDTRIKEIDSRLSKDVAGLDSHFEERLEMLKDKQKEVESALDKKLDKDREYSERLEEILKLMKK